LSQEQEARRGVLASVTAFLIWGFFPLYLHPLLGVPAEEILAHRVAWCLPCVLVWLAWKGKLDEVTAALVQPQLLSRLVLSALLMSVNWWVYTWAVVSGRVLEASLGYFIGPLVNIVLGVSALGERLSPRQWLAVSLAAGGVGWMTFAAGGLPWVSLTLALSFGVYGLVRKTAPIGAVPGLAVETLLLAPIAMAWLWFFGPGTLTGSLSTDPLTSVLLACAGLATALPLALFAAGARLIRYSVMGLITFIGPSLQWLLGITLYREPFSGAKAIGFAIIWSGVIVFIADGFLTAGAGGRKAPRPAGTGPGSPSSGSHDPR